MITFQVRLSHLISNPSHGNARRIARVASASTMTIARAMPAMTDHDASAGGIHAASQPGTRSRNDTSRPSEQGDEAFDDLGPDRSRLEPDPDRCERAFDALAIGQEDECPEVKWHARLEKERDDR
ncbi:hypothetical protein ABID58_003572 [Bradyrhizobium sp. S3.2.6]|uniref:hypothetical protein n=1 Tax=Bradyrhizobium sp. S3.2.6 TaxID=3156428 RepID=UPI00339B3FD2